MNAVGRHGFWHTDVERTDDGIRTVVVEDNVVDTEHTSKLLHIVLDVDHHLLGNALAKQLAYRCSNHLYTSLDDDERDDGAENTVKVNPCKKHDTGGDKCGECHYGIESGISTAGLKALLCNWRPCFFTYQPKTSLTTMATIIIVSVTAV